MNEEIDKDKMIANLLIELVEHKNQIKGLKERNALLYSTNQKLELELEKAKNERDETRELFWSCIKPLEELNDIINGKK